VYSLRNAIVAADGGLAELREVTAAQVRARQAQGVRAELSMPIVGGLPRLNISLAFNTLADLQWFRERDLSDPPFQAFAAKAAQLVARTEESELWELLTPTQPGNDPSYTRRLTYTATVGRGRALRETLEKRVAERQGEGIRCVLSRQLASDAPRFAVTNLFGSLADLEAFRNRLRGDAIARGFRDRVTPLLAASPFVELSEVVVPFQPVRERELVAAAGR
jgi:hypothetical protein